MLTRLAVTALFALALAPAASAAPPANDTRANAQPLAVGSTVTGTTVDATADKTDPYPCTSVQETVWYEIDTPDAARLLVRLDAAGDLDASVGVYRRDRSRLAQVACATTGNDGEAATAFDTEKGASYLVVVGQFSASPAGRFKLSLTAAEPPAMPPGTPLPAAGVRSTVDPLSNPSDAWAVTMRAGTTYRINLAPAKGHCESLLVYRPGTRSFKTSRAVRSRYCGGYIVFTPGPDGGGVYTLLVVVSYGSESEGSQGYRLQVALAGADDLAPGLELRSGVVRSGSLFGRGIDVTDLYRFDVERPSHASISLAAGAAALFDLRLVTDKGKRVVCRCGQAGGARVQHILRPGRYFLAVTAREQTGGRYRLSVLLRDITSTRLVFTPGALEAHVLPTPSGGRVRMQIDFFDPIEGWQFHRRFLVPVVNGTARLAWTPPRAGRWRAHALFLGTRTSAPSESGTAGLSVR
jgi:hypothetical protein